jgi:hypothetical protein
MSSHIHLHLGAHKTASTHFQYMLEMIDRRPAPGILIPSATTIRKEITHGNRFLMRNYKADIRMFINSLLSGDHRSVVISEENLIGEAKDFLDCDFLYKNSNNRLKAFSALLPNSQSMTIWFFIRSLDSFLPSIYCEYLRHWRYRPFTSVLSGNYLQSWLPVINTIRSVFPDANLNIVDYHQYKNVFPKILAEITGAPHESLPEQFRVIRPRLSNSAVQAASLLPLHMPPYLRHKAVDLVSQLSAFTGNSQPFSPFCSVMTQKLRDAYRRDIDSILNTQVAALLQ